MKRKIKYTLLYILLILGMMDSLFMVREHFGNPTGICNFGENLNCGAVNTSPYSTLDGISLFLRDIGLKIPSFYIANKPILLDLLLSNAFLGFCTLFLLLMMLDAKRTRNNFFFIKKYNLMNWIRSILGFSVVYGLYLIYIQHFILETYCIFCLTLDAILILAFIISLRTK